MSVFSTLSSLGDGDNEHQYADAAKNANYLNEMTILCMSMCFKFYQLLYVLYVDNKIDNVIGKHS